MSARRRAVYLVLIALCVLANWGMFRLHPQLARLRSSQAEAAELEKRRGDEQAFLALASELERVEAQLEAAGPAPHSRDPAADPGLAVSALAQQCGLLVESATPIAAPRASGQPTHGYDPAPAAALKGPAERMQRAFPERPLLRWSAWGDFAGLLRFLEQLPDLPGEPVVLELQVERAQRPGAGTEPAAPLLIRLLLAA